MKVVPLEDDQRSTFAELNTSKPTDSGGPTGSVRVIDKLPLEKPKIVEARVNAEALLSSIPTWTTDAVAGQKWNLGEMALAAAGCFATTCCQRRFAPWIPCPGRHTMSTSFFESLRHRIELGRAQRGVECDPGSGRRGRLTAGVNTAVVAFEQYAIGAKRNACAESASERSAIGAIIG